MWLQGQLVATCFVTGEGTRARSAEKGASGTVFSTIGDQDSSPLDFTFAPSWLRIKSIQSSESARLALNGTEATQVRR